MPLPATTRLPRRYLLEVASGRTVCESCGVALRRQRTRSVYPVGLLLGQPRVRSIEKQCPVCRKIYRAEDYPDVVPRHGNHAFDLIVEAGLASFLRHRQNDEIRQELQDRWGVQLACSTIREQAQSFLDYLAATHQAHVPELREHLQKDGGYVLHVDGTCEAGTGMVFNALAGNQGWTLASCKMATEDTAQIQALLQRCVQWFGLPVALVRDLSPQIEAAHQAVMPGVPDLICQYHFLENVGTKLCEKHHSSLLAYLRRLKIRPALGSLRHDLVRHAKQRGSFTPAQIEQLLTAPEKTADVDAAQKRWALAYLLLCWLEDSGADLQGEYFPFDLPGLALYRRYRTAYGFLVKMMPADPSGQAFRTLQTIARHLAPVAEEQGLVAAAERLEKAESLFNELREVLRLTCDGHHRLSPRSGADQPVQCQRRELSLQDWIDQLKQRQASGDVDRATDVALVLQYLQKYHGKLVGHVRVVDGRPQPIVVQRTNNLAEHRFARKKQGLRRKLGTKNLARYVEAMRPEEFLVDNLRDPVYLQIVCGGSLENLASSFAQNEQMGREIRSARRANKTTNRPIPAKRKLLREEGFLSKLGRAVVAAFQKRLPNERAAA